MTTMSRADRYDALAFFGSVTASLSHQINNALTIAAELNGLTDDLLAGSAGKGSVPVDRLKTVAERIASNLDRGTQYLRVLNQFAHSADGPSEACDLAATMGLVEAINRRFFDLRKARLEVSVADRAGTLRARRFDLLHAVSRCLQAALASGGDECGVRLEVAAEPQRAIVRVSLSAAGSASAEAGRLLEGSRRACARLGARLDEGGDGHFDVRIEIPRDNPAGAETEQR
jgi:C4-dicarboxylate-specific signal transduction histidine kinase